MPRSTDVTNNGFVKVRRGLGEHIKRMAPVEFKVFMALLLAADFKTHSVSLSIDTLSQMVGASYRSVNTAIKSLADERYISYKPCRNQWGASIFTILKYQSVASADSSEADTDGSADTSEALTESASASAKSTDTTSEARGCDLRKGASKNLKNKPSIVMEGKTDPKATELAALLHDLISQNFNARGVAVPKSLKPDGWAGDIDKMHRLDGYEWGDIEAAIRWCQADAFWSQNILSGAKLRRQMHQIVMKSKQPREKVSWF